MKGEGGLSMHLAHGSLRRGHTNRDLGSGGWSVVNRGQTMPGFRGFGTECELRAPVVGSHQEFLNRGVA